MPKTTEPYTLDELLRAIGLLGSNKSQYGYNVRSNLDLNAILGNKAEARNFSNYPRTGQFVFNPAMTGEQQALLGPMPGYSSVSPTGEEMGPTNSMMYLQTPTGGKPVPITRDELSRFLELPEGTRNLIANMTPEEYYRLKSMGGEGTPGVREEGLTPPTSPFEPGTSATTGAPAVGSGEWLKEKRDAMNKSFAVFGQMQEGLKTLQDAADKTAARTAKAMMSRNLDPLTAYNKLMSLNAGTTPDYTLPPEQWPSMNLPWNPGAKYTGPLVAPTQPVAPTGGFGSPEWATYLQQKKSWEDWNKKGGAADWFKGVNTLYGTSVNERANQIMTERLIPFDKAKRLALKQMKVTTGGSGSLPGTITNTWG